MNWKPSTESPSSIEERLAWISLARFPGIGSRRLARLLSRHHSAAAILRLPSQLLQHDERFLAPLLGDPTKVIEQTRKAVAENMARGIGLLIPPDPDFPARLRQIPDPPVLLYVLGDRALLNRPAVAIVGSRDHSRYGQDTATSMAQAAAGAGIVIVSGMARGLDAVAHQAALDVGGGTIGVLGCGIGHVYPSSNRELYRRVEEEGLLLTEHPPAERPHAGAFPRRNRLISGLAQVLVVVEAARQSGTMLTVAAALEQGRTVMAVPGPINSAVSTGTNQLLRDGAEHLLVPTDLLRQFGCSPASDVIAVGITPPPAHLSSDEARIFNTLSGDYRSLDEITLAAGFPAGTSLALLCGLELGGLVFQNQDGCFRRA